MPGLLSDKRSATVGKDRSNAIIQITFCCKHPQAGAVQLCEFYFSVQVSDAECVVVMLESNLWNLLNFVRRLLNVYNVATIYYETAMRIIWNVDKKAFSSERRR